MNEIRILAGFAALLAAVVSVALRLLFAEQIFTWQNQREANPTRKDNKNKNRNSNTSKNKNNKQHITDNSNINGSKNNNSDPTKSYASMRI